MVVLSIFIMLIIIGVGLLFFMWLQAKQDNIIENTLEFVEFPESFGELKIFFISDIHRRVISPKILAEINGKVDLVIIGGDLCEKGVPFERIEENLSKLRAIAPSYFVWGNNDYEVDFHTLDLLLQDHGIKIIDNTAYTFESESGDKIAVLGVDDVSLNRHRLDLALLDAEQDVKFKILVSHNPKISQSISQSDKISLVLAGHTHGGQIRIFNMGPYTRGGIESKGVTTLLTSNGYGTTQIPLRLGAPPETHVITIKSKNKSFR